VNSSDAGITGSGSAGQVAYFTGATTQAGSNNLVFDNTNGRLTISLNQNAQTRLLVSNTTSGTASEASLVLTSSGGSVGFSKYSATTSAYKILSANDAFIFNSTVGDIAILNDVAAGVIKFAAGASSTSQMVLNTSGNLGLGSGTINGTGRVLALYHATDSQIRLQSANTGQTSADGALISLASDNAMYVYNYENSPIILGTNNTERARIFANGNFGIGTGATDSGQRLQVIGTGYFSDSVGIGNSGSVASSLRISKALATGNTIGIYMDSQIQSTLSNVAYFQSEASTSASAITITHLRHYFATAPSFGAGSTVTNQYGFAVQGSTLINATNNYGFWGDIAAGTGRWNLYMGGTANNYMAGSLGIGTNSPLYKLDVQGTSNTVAIRSASNTSGDILYYATGTVTGSLNAFTTSINATGSVGASLQNNNTATGLAFLDINVPSASTGDPYLTFTTSGATNWSVGIDNSDSDKLKISPSSSPSAGTPAITFHTTGNTSLGSAADTGEKLQVTGTAKITGNFTGGAIVSAATEFRLNNQAFSRIAKLDGSGGFGGGYNVDYSSVGVVTHAATGGIAGMVYSATGSLFFYTNTSQTAGTTATERMRLSSAGNLAIGAASDTGERLQVTGTAKITGNLAVDTETLFVDATNNRIGIGTTSPSQKLDVRDGMISVQRNSDSSVVNFNVFSGVTPVSAFQINSDQSNLTTTVTSRNSYVLNLATNDTARIQLKTEGHVRFVPLSAAPTTNVQSGDVYYDSTTNKLRCYNGTTWNDLF
jgi:hypothetical protein